MRDVCPTTEQLACIVRQAFPDAQIAATEPVPGDHANVLCHLSLDNGLELTLKLYTDAAAPEAPQHEAHLLRMLTSETGVPVPRVLGSGAGGDDPSCAGLLGAPWALLTRLPGCSLTGVAHLLDEWELEALGYEAGRYLARLHVIALDRFGSPLARGEHDRDREAAYVVAQANAWLDRCAEEGLLPPATRDALRAHLAQSSVLNRRQPCLVHGRFRARDIIVAPGTTGHHVTGFVDLTGARAAAPELDLSAPLGIDFSGMPGIKKGFLDGYAEAGDLSAAFWDRLAVYQAFTALDWLLLAHRQGRTQDMRAYRDLIDRVLDDRTAPDSP